MAWHAFVVKWFALYPQMHRELAPDVGVVAECSLAVLSAFLKSVSSSPGFSACPNFLGGCPRLHTWIRQQACRRGGRWGAGGVLPSDCCQLLLWMPMSCRQLLCQDTASCTTRTAPNESRSSYFFGKRGGSVSLWFDVVRASLDHLDCSNF